MLSTQSPAVIGNVDKLNILKPEIIHSLLEKIELYKKSKDANRQTTMEMLGFALALSRELRDETTKSLIDEKILGEIKAFILEDLSNQKRVELDKFSENLDSYKCQIDLIRLKSSRKNLSFNMQEALEQWLKSIISYTHDLLEGPPDACEYAILGLGSLAMDMMTSYSDIGYIVILKEYTDRYKTYFSNFSDLFRLLMLGFGETPLLKSEALLADYRSFFHLIKTGARLSQHIQPNIIDRKLGFINTSHELLSLLPLPDKVTHHLGSHTTAALLTAKCLDTNDKELFSHHQEMLMRFLPSQEYFIYLVKLLKEGSRSCHHLLFRLESASFSEEKSDGKFELKEFLLHSIHLARLSLIFIRTAYAQVKLPTTIAEILLELKIQQLLSEEQRISWLSYVEKINSLRIELQIKSGNVKAAVLFCELEQMFSVEKIIENLKLSIKLTENVLGKYNNDKTKAKLLPLQQVASKKQKEEKDFSESWNLPPPNDHYFIGRETELILLQKSFGTKKEGQAVALSAISGLGGIGKTQLATYYIHHSIQSYQLRLWFQAETENTLLNDYWSLIRRYKLPLEEKASKEDVIRTIKYFISRFSSWIAVYDNAGSYKDLKDFLPLEIKGGHLIITTRYTEWHDIGNKIELDVFSKEESISYIKKILQREKEQKENEESAIIQLAVELGYLPLALAQASAYIKQRGESVRGYLELHQKFTKEMLEEKTFPVMSDVKSIATTWNISLKAIQHDEEKETSEHPKLSLAVLQAMSYLDPDHIPRYLLEHWLQIFNVDTKMKSAKLSLNKSIGHLLNYSMIQVDPELYTFSVHRLVQQIGRISLLESATDTLAQKIHILKSLLTVLFSALEEQAAPVASESKAAPIAGLSFSLGSLIETKEIKPIQKTSKNQHTEDFYRRKALVPHVIRFIQYYEEACPADEKYLSLLDKLGSFYFEMGENQNCIELLSKCLIIKDKFYNKELNSEIARTMQILGRAFGRLGQHEKQQELLSKALDIFKEKLGANNLEVAETYCYLSASYGGLNKYDTQLSLLEKALIIVTKSFPRDHIEAAKVLKRMGNAYAQLMHPEKQRDLLEEILPIFEKHYGKDHPEVGDILNSLGWAYGSLNDREARPELLNHKKELVEKALAIYKNYYGSKSMLTTDVMINLADTNGDLKNYSEMQVLCEEALDNINNIYGKEDSYYALALIYLAKCHGYQNRKERKRRILNESLKIIEKVNGSDRTFTLALHHLDEIDNPEDKVVELEKLKWLHRFRLKKFGASSADTIRIALKIKTLEASMIQLETPSKLKSEDDLAVTSNKTSTFKIAKTLHSKNPSQEFKPVLLDTPMTSTSSKTYELTNRLNQLISSLKKACGGSNLLVKDGKVANELTLKLTRLKAQAEEQLTVIISETNEYLLEKTEAFFDNCKNQLNLEIALLEQESSFTLEDRTNCLQILRDIVRVNFPPKLLYMDSIKGDIGLKENALRFSQAIIVKAIEEKREAGICFLDILKKIKVTMGSTVYSCFISYAWPKHPKDGPDRFIQPFLEILQNHLIHAGIIAKLDYMSVSKGENIEAFMTQLPTENHWLMIGTQSLAFKFEIGTNVRFEIELEKHRHIDFKRIFPMIPILVSGDSLHSFPWHIQRRSMLDFTTQSYVSSIKELLFHLTHLPKSTYEELWQPFVSKYPEFMEPLDESLTKNLIKKEAVLQEERNKLIKERQAASASHLSIMSSFSVATVHASSSLRAATR